jgi:hypothetical protein
MVNRADENQRKTSVQLSMNTRHHAARCEAAVTGLNFLKAF